MEKPKHREPKEKSLELVWAFILGYYSDHAYAPTLAEIGEHFTDRTTGEWKSRQWAKYMVDELARQGHIEVEPGKHRGIKLIPWN